MQASRVDGRKMLSWTATSQKLSAVAPFFMPCLMLIASMLKLVGSAQPKCSSDTFFVAATNSAHLITSQSQKDYSLYNNL